MRTLGLVADSWNHFADDADIRRYAERESWRRIEREYLPCLRPIDVVNIVFIRSRTFGWQKYAEAIPMHHFIHGVRDEAGDLLIDQSGQPVSSGTGIAKEDTVRSSLKRLVDLGLIEMIAGQRRSITPANIYMPASQTLLAQLVLQAGSGILPPRASRWHVGEHVRLRGQPGIWQIVGGEGHQIDVLRRDVVRSSETQRTTAFSPDIERMTRSDWREFSRQ